MAEKYANAFWTHLTAPMLVGDSTAHVALAAPAALQGGQFRVSIGTELLLVTAGQNTTTWTVTRAIESTTAAAHRNGLTVAHLTTTASLLGATGVFDVRAFGWDAATDKAVAIRAAVTAAEAAGGGVVTLPPVIGAAWNSTVTVSSIAVSIVGPGSAACTFACGGAGDHLLVQPSPFTVSQCGRFAGFTLNGSASASAVGIHHVNTIGIAFDDVVVSAFTGATAVGLWSEAEDAGAGMKWTERTSMHRVHLNGNKVNWKVSGASSFGFTRVLDLRLNVNDGQTGIEVSGAAVLYNSVIVALANVHDAGIVLDAKDTATVSTTHFTITGEQTSGVDGVGLKAAAGASVSGYGTVYLGQPYALAGVDVTTALAGSVLTRSGPSLDVEGMVRQNLRKEIAVTTPGGTVNYDFPALLDATHGFTGFVALSLISKWEPNYYLRAFFAAATHHGPAPAWYPMTPQSLHTVNTFPDPGWGGTAVVSWVNGDLRVAVTWGAYLDAGRLFEIDVALFGTLPFST